MKKNSNLKHRKQLRKKLKMNQDKLNKRVEFLRQDKNKSENRVSTLDAIQDVWIEGDNDDSLNYLADQGLQI